MSGYVRDRLRMHGLVPNDSMFNVGKSNTVTGRQHERKRTSSRICSFRECLSGDGLHGITPDLFLGRVRRATGWGASRFHRQIG